MTETGHCPSCNAPVVGEDRFCRSCGTALEPLLTDQTIESLRTPNDHGKGDVGATPPASDDQAISSSDRARKMRFVPGTTFAGRYRIVALLGRGGMGEVYLADDLTLDQQVALKFLPESFARDPGRIQRFNSEVRLARQITHPNVCRVHDVGNSEGQTYLSMEYVDGEDLASLLRRIGRLPRDKALEIARQLCAGLAAAHRRGVLHRDLKPANIMIDGEGTVRITDFGLAAVGSTIQGAEIRSGTPAYMAPEQLAGREVTIRSDIYALGLVLYETLTGQRAIQADTVQEIQQLHESTTPESPTSIVREIDPALEQVILRCLEKQPEARPGSALAVAAALPGGDPLAAALAAGETPSPELVANASRTKAVRPLIGWLMLFGILAGLISHGALKKQASILGIYPLEKPPALLEDRARQILEVAGYDEPFEDAVSGFSRDRDFLMSRYVQAAAPDQREGLGERRPSFLYYWYRQSPRYLNPIDPSGRVGQNDPPFDLSGMIRVRLDTEGRLLRFEAVPPQVPMPDSVDANVDWDKLFEQADLDPNMFRETEPEWTPGIFADERSAWIGSFPGQPNDTIRIEAAAFEGRPVQFLIRAPWTRPSRMAEARQLPTRVQWDRVLTIILLAMALFGGVYVTRRNLRLGRGDWRGATRIGAVILLCNLLSWIFMANHGSSPVALFNNFIEYLSIAVFFTAFLWVLYVALEPYVRRRWPNQIVSWTCLLTGRFRDPQVGRDILVGALFAIGVGLLDLLHVLVPPMLGLRGARPYDMGVGGLIGLDHLIGQLFAFLPVAVLNALILVFFPILLLMIVRKQWLAILLFVVLLGLIFAMRNTNMPIGPIVGLLEAVVFIFVAVRFGLLALAVTFLIYFGLDASPISLDFTTWYAPQSLVALVFILGLVIYGFRICGAMQALEGKDLLQDLDGQSTGTGQR